MIMLTHSSERIFNPMRCTNFIELIHYKNKTIENNLNIFLYNFFFTFSSECSETYANKMHKNRSNKIFSSKTFALV